MTSHAATAESTSRRSRRPRAGAVLALGRRDYLVTRSYRAFLVLQTLFGLLNLLVYYFISRTFEGVQADLGGAPTYFDFAVVGVAIAVVIQAATNGVAQRVREEQLTGTLEALLLQPITSTEVSLGLAALPFLFATVTAAFYVVVAGGLLGVDLSNADWPGFVVMLVVSGTALSSIGILAAGAVLVIKRGGQALVGAVTFGMGLISGAVFPISVLPDWLEAIGRVMPTRFAFDGIRAALFLGDGWGDDAVVLVAFSVV